MSLSNLLKKYEKAPTRKNAEAVAAHCRRYTMASCMLSTYELTWLEIALEQAGES